MVDCPSFANESVRVNDGLQASPTLAGIGLGFGGVIAVIVNGISRSRSLRRTIGAVIGVGGRNTRRNQSSKKFPALSRD